MTDRNPKISSESTIIYKTDQDLLEWMDHNSKHYGRFYEASIFGSSAFVIGDPEYVRHILQKNWRNYRKGQIIKRIAFLLGNGLMVSEGEVWRRQRRMVQPAFHHDVIDGLTRLIKTANLSLLEKWQTAAQKKESVNVTRDLSQMILEVVLVSIFGNDYRDVSRNFNIVSEISTRDLEFAQQFRSLDKIILECVDRRRRTNSTFTDILGMLMEVRDRETGKVMSDRQLVNEIKTLIVAGHETTASSLNWAWYLISQHPEVEKKLSHELNNLLLGDRFPELVDLPNFAYTRQVIDETLRLYPAGWLITRRALKDDQIGDHFVPGGTEIYISPYLIQRDPDLWEEPDCFDPDRFDPDRLQDRHRLAMLPFSAGPRNCIGEFLARIEMQIHLMLIAKQLRLQYVQTKPLELEAGVNLRNRYDFIMTPECKIH